MDDSLARELRIVKAYALGSSALMAILCLAAFANRENTRFSQIDVERINVIEKDGTKRMIISGKGSFPGVIVGKKEFSSGREVAGMLFYNDEGTEQGGLTFTGKRRDNGYVSTGSLSFDRYNQDQVIGLQSIDENGESYAGLSVWDRPAESLLPYLVARERAIAMPQGVARKAALDSLAKIPGATGSAQRIFIGRNQDQTAIVNLKDRNGHTRLRLAVDSLGVPRLEFLDDKGNVVFLLRDSASVKR